MTIVFAIGHQCDVSTKLYIHVVTVSFLDASKNKPLLWPLSLLGHGRCHWCLIRWHCERW